MLRQLLEYAILHHTATSRSTSEFNLHPIDKLYSFLCHLSMAGPYYEARSSLACSLHSQNAHNWCSIFECII